jgi:hypothetical protein
LSGFGGTRHTFILESVRPFQAQHLKKHCRGFPDSLVNNEVKNEGTSGSPCPAPPKNVARMGVLDDLLLLGPAF